MSGFNNALFGEASPPKKARIEVIPLIDVVFFLLATFVLFTLSLNQTGGIRVKLPTAVHHEERDPENAVTITVMQDGRIGWNKEEISLNQFVARLPIYKAETLNPSFLINADTEARFTQVQYVLNEIRKMGIYSVNLEVNMGTPDQTL